MRSLRRAIVVLVGQTPASDDAARKLTSSLRAVGVHATYCGHQSDAREIATLVAAERADTVELCLGARTGGVAVLRQLLRHLIEIGRRDVSIVVHRIR